MRSRILALATLFAALSQAAVTRVEITQRADTPVPGFERIGGRIHFAVDPKLAANQIIADIGLAPKNAQGLVEFSSDFLVLRPKDPAKSNGTALLEIVNRGRSLMWSMMNPNSSAALRNAQDYGDNFLLQQGFTIVWVGWQFDVNPTANTFKVYAPVIRNITGPVRLEILTNNRSTTSDVFPYPLADTDSGTLTVRDAPYAPRSVIPRSEWRYNAENTRIEYADGFTPGRLYEFVYTAKDPVVAGVGFAAVRDYISYIKESGIAPGVGQRGDIDRAIAFGFSQSGRVLRTFLYDGFNTGEQGRPVFEGIWAHGAGAGHGGFNQRFVQPGRTTGQFSGSFYPTDLPPFTPAEILHKSPNTKLIVTNGSHEYWGRAAALNHVTPDGARDADPPANVRIYAIASTQHGGGGGAASPTVQNITNSLDVTYFLRATLVNLNAWVTRNVAPPPSQFPRLDKGTLVPVASLSFPLIPGLAVVNYAYAPRRLDFGPDFETKGVAADEPPRAGGAYPALVPQVDTDGNDIAGVRMPELRYPLATYTGWNLRAESVGAPEHQYSLIGSMAAFARTPTQRDQQHDARPSINERYQSRQQYLSRIESAARELVQQRFLLEADISRVVNVAGRHWDAVVK